MPISDIHTQMIDLLRKSIHSQNETYVDNLDFSLFPDIEKELENHTVQFLVTDRILKLDTSDIEISDFIKDAGCNVKDFYSILVEQETIFSIFNEADIPCVVLKGCATAINYPVPEYRVMGDIDLLVLEKDIDRAYDCLINNGYSLVEREVEYKRHIEFNSRTGIEIELHRYFSHDLEVKKNVLLDNMLQDAILKREHKELFGYSFDILPPLENGLVLLSHIDQHLSGGLGLRQIIDWMMFVEKYVDDSFWNESFCSACELIGLRTLAETTTLLCQKYLGLPTSITWCKNADESLSDDLLEYILKKGNFGKKDIQSNLTLNIMRNFRNPILTFKYLTAGGMNNWTLARKYPILKSFAWIYQIGHLIRKGLNRKVGLKTLFAESKHSKEELELLKRLGVSRFNS